jgi:hypothetical protein
VIAAALALALQGQEAMAHPPPYIYRWKNSQGQVHVTTTLPPPGAVVIETMHSDGADSAVVLALAPTPEEMRASLESALKAETVAYWRGIDESFSRARQSKDPKGQVRALDDVFASALLGNGLWVAPLIPATLAGACALLAWRSGFGRPKRARAAIWAGSVGAYLLLSQVCIQVAVHGPQARRLGFALSMLPHYLGGHAQIGPEGAQAIAGHAKALSGASSPMAAAWAFPLETGRTRRTLARLLEGLGSEAPQPRSAAAD